MRRPWLAILQGEDLGSGSQHLPNKPHNRPISLLPPITFPALAAQTDPRPMVIQLPGRLPEMFYTVARLLTCQVGDYNVIYPLQQSRIVILKHSKNIVSYFVLDKRARITSVWSSRSWFDPNQSGELSNHHRTKRSKNNWKSQNLLVNWLPGITCLFRASSPILTLEQSPKSQIFTRATFSCKSTTFIFEESVFTQNAGNV